MHAGFLKVGGQVDPNKMQVEIALLVSKMGQTWKGQFVDNPPYLGGAPPCVSCPKSAILIVQWALGDC